MAKKIKKPIKKGVAKVPVIMQLEALECGAASLTMVLAYYDKWIPLEQVRRDCGVCRDGSNARNIISAARYYGFETNAYRFEPEDLKNEGQFPCIIHWNFNHFVVCDGFKGNKVYLNDPARGAYAVSMETFDESFTGVAILLEPSENFEPSGKPKSVLTFIGKYLKGTNTAFAFTMAMSVISAITGIIQPAFSRIFMDRLINGQNADWMWPFLIAFALFSAITIAVNMINSIYSLRINGKMAAVGNATYLYKVMKLPMNFFSQRMAGDIQSRQMGNATIANTLINIFAPQLLNTVMLVFYLVVMLRFSIPLTLIGLATVTINSLISTYISKKRVEISRLSTRDNSKLSSYMVAGIEMIETIKAAGGERGYFNKWSSYQASVNNNNIRSMKLNQYLGLVPQLVSSISNTAIVIIGVYLTMTGKFTVGMIMQFQGFLGSFMAPATSLISSGQQIQEMRTAMERIDDVMEYPDDNLFKEDEDIDSFKKLSGNIEIKNVSFGYAPLGKPLIKNFNLSIKPGQSVALVGGSGCGKSTMSKLISGLNEPWSGEILFDGKPIKDINKAIFKGSLAVVDQDIIVFEDTIANNIKMWDESIEDFEMILACRDAQIHDDIMARPEGYKHKLIEGGKDFSGGQRQRLEIARVLAQDPSIIIMDEATSALDAKTEYEVLKAIKNRGITCIVIAHRLSIIRSCDEIIVMDKGEIVDRGTHSQLIESSKLYHDLVANE